MSKIQPSLDDIVANIRRYTNVTADSRQVRNGSLFVAIRGDSSDGHRFIQNALDAGAPLVIAQTGATERRDDRPIVYVDDTRLALARLAQAFCDYPSNNLLSIAVTGTNGKTSVAWILSEALALNDLPTAHLGTLGCRLKTAGDPGTFSDLNNTTPDIVLTCEFLQRNLEHGAKACVMEVSSHALVQQRTRGMAWNGAVFTNLTRDHLDFHQTMDDYREAKRRLYSVELAESQKPARFFVANVDDPTAVEFAEDCAKRFPEIRTLRVCSESTSISKKHADVSVLGVNYQPTGTDLELSVDGLACGFHSRLLGEYNVSNMVSALGALLGAGLNVERSLQLLSQVPPVPGRLELVAPHEIRVFVDYAHTPDALTRAQRSLKDITPGRLITVFGCGGNRDRGKRPLMAQAVQEVADIAVVTSDNPRNESPEVIVSEAVQGFKSQAIGGESRFQIFVEVDRRQAIRQAIQLAQPGDSILIAGKGHEPYQEIQGVKHPFSDQQVAREFLTGGASAPR